MTMRMDRPLARFGLLSVFGMLSVVGAAALAPAVRADTLLDQSSLIAAPGVAAPSEFSFTASTAQALVVTLTDAQQPAAFQTLQIAVTLGDKLVGTASVDGTTGVTSATVNLPAATGNYEFHVIGTPASSGFGSFGSFSVCTAPQATPAACIAADSYSDNIEAPSTASTTGTSTLNTTFTSTTAGTYTVRLTDDQFPTALTTLSGGITQGSTPIIQLAPGTTSVTLAAATSYQVLIAGIANSSVEAGLYSIQITDPTGKAIFTQTLPVGELASATTVTNPAAGSLSLSLKDQQYPSALSGVGVAVTSAGSLLGELTTSGSTTLTAVAGSLSVWEYAVAGAEPGSYTVSLSAGTTSLLSATQVVNPANAAASPGSYAFAVDLPAAGLYQLVVTDFQFPSELATLTYTVAQNGTVIQPDSNGNFTVTAAGSAIIVVAATPTTGGNETGVGIFGITVTTTGASPTVLLDQTQGVGGVFTTQTLNVGESGAFDATLTDLGFPATFQNLAVLVSQQSQVVGKIYGGGSFPINATPGPYVVTFVATPGTQNYGLYALNISSAPPTVTLTASATSVVSGQSVQLSWTSTSATSCSASGAPQWSGAEATSSTGLAVQITSDVTLSLTCTGPGGSATQTVSVNVTTAPASSHGGGALDPATIALLSLLTLALRGRDRFAFRPRWR
jgi:hypothetical protein